MIQKQLLKHFLNENNCGANIYCFSQNNKGVLNQFFRKNNSEAKLYYNRACENGFPLAYYIRGFLNESEGDHDSTISDYKNASEIFENDYKLVLNKITVKSEYLINSMIFIICLANLQITNDYLSKSDTSNAKTYFCRVFSKIINDDYQFEVEINNNNNTGDNLFDDIRNLIFNYPDFNIDKIEKIENEQTNNNNNLLSKKLNAEHNNFPKKLCNPDELFQFATSNAYFTTIFINEINKTIKQMNNILYTYPYVILFGMMKIKINSINSNRQNQNKSFIEGFDQ